MTPINPTKKKRPLRKYVVIIRVEALHVIRNFSLCPVAGCFTLYSRQKYVREKAWLKVSYTRYPDRFQADFPGDSFYFLTKW